MLLSCEEMKRAEAAAFARGVRVEDLMEPAGRGIAEVIRQFQPHPGTCVVFAGKGNNGGDARIAARHLEAWGWKIREPGFELGRGDRPLIIIDGLLGIGTRGAPREPVASAIRQINALRKNRSARVFAVDLPTGLDGGSGIPADPCVQADVTITLGQPKTCLVQDVAANHVGRIAFVPLPELTATEGNPAQLSCPETLRSFLPPRDFDSHKGTHGRIGLIAGSEGFLGAARLCSAAALHGGAGLVTLFARREIYPSLAGTVAPEIMVQPVDHYGQALEFRLNVLALGPGLGRWHDAEALDLIEKAHLPLVVDADALNALSTHLDRLKNSRGPRLLTPHLGEMARLFPEGAETRREAAETFTGSHPVTLLMKSSRSLVAEQGKVLFYNPTGNPGMGSGGMGDVLTGVCAALLGQGLAPAPAAAVGAWVCGRAAEIACQYAESEESLSAAHVISHLGLAFRSLREGDY
ncbi:MAG TPA: NAD(P)H-hydrate dehydratase [Chthoniobacterales bacterium]